MAFAEPHYLVILTLLLPLGALAFWRLEWTRRRDLEVFAARRLLERFSALTGRRRLLGETLLLVALCFILAALARPQFGEKPVVLSRTGRDVLFVLDLSRSMNAEDVRPSRLQAAKQAIREILEASPGDRVGLVIFGGSAFLQVPLTLDRAAFELFLDAASTDAVSDPGTNVASALAVAAGAFGSESEPRYRVTIVLSDGESHGGDLGASLARLEESGIRAFTLGLGTPGGGPIPNRVGDRLLGYHRDAAGEVAVTRLEEEDLRRIAEETDGKYFGWEGGAGVRDLAGELARLEKREISSRMFTQLADRYQWPLAAALLALLAEGMLLGTARPRAAPALLFLVLLGLARPAEVTAQDDGERLYRAGDFAGAYESFRRAAAKEGSSPALDYNIGNTLYRLGRYADAAGSYRAALAGPQALRQKSLYNMGNAFVKASESQPEERTALRRAVSAYEEALVLDPGDRAAKWNLELALRKLMEQERRMSGGGAGGGGREGEREGPSAGGDGGGGGGGDGEEQADAAPQVESGEEQPAGAAAVLSEEQARRLLEAIRGEEAETLEGRNRGRARVSSGERDW